MRTVINPPSLSTLLSAWLRGGLSVVLSVGLTWLLASLLLHGGLFGSLAPFLIGGAVLWTALIFLQALFEHTVTIGPDELHVRTWTGALLGRPGRAYPIQQPRLTMARRAGRGGGGLRSKRMWLLDDAGRPHRYAFTLLSYNTLANQLADALGRGGVRPY